MPYSSKAKLPAAVKALPDHAQSIFMAAFNAAYEKQGETAAFAIAWSAVKNKYKKSGEKWVAKDSGFEYNELVTLDAGGLRQTVDGYLVGAPRVARTGIQIYRGDEVGKPEMDEVRVFRPESTVFAKDSLASFAYRPITMNHPGVMVNSKNWKDHSVGQSSGEIARDGEYVRIPMVLMDEQTIQQVRQGHCELSVGYYSDLNWETGKSPSGETYDAVQQNIRVNHIAVVAQARGGPKLRLGDGKGERTMARIINIDGVDLSFEDDTTASIVQRAIQRANDEVKAIKDQLTQLTTRVTDTETKLTAATKAGETKDGEILALKKQVKDGEVTPDKLHKMVADRAELIDRACKCLGNIDLKSQTDAEIKRLVVSKDLGDAVAKAMSDEAIAGAFLSVTSRKGGNAPVNDTRSLARSFDTGVNSNDVADMTDQAWEEQGRVLADAWKGAAPQAPRAQAPQIQRY